jgi:HAD superfamily hydrolase (TIGR01490 family)
VDSPSQYRLHVSERPAERKGAAFFDLDKTILAKSSSFAFARPFYKEGLIGRSDVIRSAYAQFVYLASGADHDQMETMREYMSKLVTGWDAEKVQAIVGETLDDIVDPMVYEEAVQLIEEHKEAGRDVIIISSSGTDIVEPIGQRLGVDLAIGTQVAIEEGQYTGEIVFYAYGPNKAEAMRTLSEERGYDLAESFAWSAIPSPSIPTPSYARSPSSESGRSSTSGSRSPCASRPPSDRPSRLVAPSRSAPWPWA